MSMTNPSHNPSPNPEPVPEPNPSPSKRPWESALAALRCSPSPPPCVCVWELLGSAPCSACVCACVCSQPGGACEQENNLMLCIREDVETETR